MFISSFFFIYISILCFRHPNNVVENLYYHLYYLYYHLNKCEKKLHTMKRELTHAKLTPTYVKPCRGILVISFGNEQKHLDK